MVGISVDTAGCLAMHVLKMTLGTTFCSRRDASRPPEYELGNNSQRRGTSLDSRQHEPTCSGAGFPQDRERSAFSKIPSKPGPREKDSDK